MAANNFTEATSKTLNAAVELATSKGHALVEPAHVAAKLFASGELGDRIAKKAGADAVAELAAGEQFRGDVRRLDEGVSFARRELYGGVQRLRRGFGEVVCSHYLCESSQPNFLLRAYVWLAAIVLRCNGVCRVT